MNRFATPVWYAYWYVSDSWHDSKYIFYKDTKQYPKFIETLEIAENARQANEMKVAFENMCKWSMFDKMKKELEEARLQIKDLQSNMVEKVNTDEK